MQRYLYLDRNAFAGFSGLRISVGVMVSFPHPVKASGGGRIFIIRGLAIGVLLRCGLAACRLPWRDAVSGLGVQGVGGVGTAFFYEPECFDRPGELPPLPESLFVRPSTVRCC